MSPGSRFARVAFRPDKFYNFQSVGLHSIVANPIAIESHESHIQKRSHTQGGFIVSESTRESEITHTIMHHYVNTSIRQEYQTSIRQHSNISTCQYVKTPIPPHANKSLRQYANMPIWQYVNTSIRQNAKTPIRQYVRIPKRQYVNTTTR